MFNFKNLFFILLCSVIFTGFVAAQLPPPAFTKSQSSSNNSKNEQNFVSLDGGFTVALPQRIDAFAGIKPTEGVNKGGSQFTWKTPQGFFMIAYADRIFLPEEYKQILQGSANSTVEQVTNNGGKLISKNEISLEGNSGIEIRMHLKEGAVGLSRFILVKDRMYILTTGWKDGSSGKEQMQVLDTFKLIDRKIILAQKIEKDTPPSLPQSPIVKKLKSDADDETLKGKVKSVTRTTEDLTGTGYVIGVKMSSEDFYDENGSRVKNISYDYKGNPSDVIVYGYIDGMRVSKRGSINYEYNPPPPMMSSSAEKPKPFDARFDSKYEYQYDEKGRLKETVNYRNNGEISSRATYSYDGNKLEKSWFNADGKIYSKVIDLLDDKSNVVEHTFVYVTSDKPDSKTIYTYDSFDEKGNWTKRTISEYKYGNKEPRYIEYRTIAYYQ